MTLKNSERGVFFEIVEAARSKEVANARLESARRLLEVSKQNVEFIQKRIAIQNEPGFNRYDTPSGASVRIYIQLDIDKELDRIFACNQIIESYKTE